jgi:nuclease S1
MNRAVAFAIAALPAVLHATASYAWGYQGHQIVAAIAAHELTAKARANVTELLGGDAEAEMIIASTWADEIRPSRHETGPWHYVNIPISSNGYDATRNCPDNNCVIAQIKADKDRIADPHLLPAVRREALRFLIHFVGDVHQPLHAANNDDRGGNMAHVIIDGECTNLHAVWDTNVVNALGSDTQSLARQLEGQTSATDIKQWQTGDAADWANESFNIAKSHIYAGIHGTGSTDAPIVLPAGYAEQNKSIAAQRLERAGARLAYLINEAFH